MDKRTGRSRMNLIDRDELIGKIRKTVNLVAKNQKTEYSRGQWQLIHEFLREVEEMPIENPPEIEAKTKPTKDQIVANRKHNQQYLNLDDTEFFLHEKLMEVDISSYPKELHDFLDKEHAGDLFNGDAFSCWVADWIKSLRDKPKEKRRVWTCLNCGKDITYPISTDIVVHERAYFHWSRELPRTMRRRCCDDNYNEPLTATNLAIPKPDSERWVED
jgi:hypothetical protein